MQPQNEKNLYDLSQAERETLLRTSWMYHDYQWYQNTIEAVGPEHANRNNQEAIYVAGKGEMTRLMRALRIYPVRSIENVIKLILAANDLYIGKMVQMRLSNGPDWLHFGAAACFSREGTRKDGLESSYFCGALKRISGWLAAMNVEHKVEPEIGLCLPAQGKPCSFLVRLKADWLKP
jgi:hypothetical protein